MPPNEVCDGAEATPAVQPVEGVRTGDRTAVVGPDGPREW